MSANKIADKSSIDELAREAWTRNEHRRDGAIEFREFNDETRTCEMSFASELPVKRYDWGTDKYYMEVLSCDAADCDLTRLNNSAPLLLNHDTRSQPGVIEPGSARCDSDKKARCKTKFSKSTLGTEIWNDTKDGIRRLVSVGYSLGKELSREMKDGLEHVRFAWAPFEVSIVSIPADATVGIGRNKEILLSPSKKEQIKVSETKIDVVSEAPKRDFAKDNAEIIAISKNLADKVDGIRDLSDKALSEGWTVDQFRAQALNKLPEAKPIVQSPLAEVKSRDWQRYSISRAIVAHADGKLSGFEAEMDQELALKHGKRAAGFYLPDEAFRNHIAGTNTLGGFLVQNTVVASEFIEILRNRSQVLNLGARVVSLPGPAFFPRQNGAGTANWVAETTASTLSATNFTNLTLTPKAITTQQQYSKQLLMTGNPSIDSLVRDDMTKIMALAIDLAALHGAGTAEPVGIAGTTGINTVTLAANGLVLGNTTAYPALVSLETAVANSNADVGSLAYLMRPGHRGALRNQVRFSSDVNPIWGPNGNTVNGYRAEVSNQIATNLTTGTATTICSAIFFGNWADLIIASFGSTDVTVDNITLAGNRVIRLYADRYADIGVRHPASFAVMGGVLTT